MVEGQAQFVIAPVRARKDDESIVIELPVRNRYQRIVMAAVVPSEGPMMSPSGAKQLQDALHVARAGLQAVFFLFVLDIGHHPLKETRGWHLLAVADDHYLLDAVLLLRPPLDIRYLLG